MSHVKSFADASAVQKFGSCFAGADAAEIDPVADTDVRGGEWCLIKVAPARRRQRVTMPQVSSLERPARLSHDHYRIRNGLARRLYTNACTYNVRSETAAAAR